MAVEKTWRCAKLMSVRDKTRVPMSQPLQAAKSYQYLSQRSDSSYRELFITGTKIRAQSIVSEMENECLTPAAVAADYHVPVEAVVEAIEYVHANEAYLASERRRERQQAIEQGDLKPDSE